MAMKGRTVLIIIFIAVFVATCALTKTSSFEIDIKKEKEVIEKDTLKTK